MVHRILQNISFNDYVHLMYTCKSAFAALDNDEVYKVVWDTHFDRKVKSCEWPAFNSMEWNPWRDVYFRSQELLRHIRNLRGEYLAVYENGEYVNAGLVAKAEKLVSMMVMNSVFLVPLVHLSTVYWEEFCQATIDRVPYDMFMMCITRYLLHLLNVHIAHSYFMTMTQDTKDGVKVLRCLFELSRLDFGFFDLAAKRQEVFEKVSRTQLDGTTRRDGYLVFASHDRFEEFIANTCNHLLSLLPKCDKTHGGRVSLREFSHPTGIAHLFTLATLADYISTRIFEKHKVEINGALIRQRIEIAAEVLSVGGSRFKLAENLRTLNPIGHNTEYVPLSYKTALRICESYVNESSILMKQDPPISELSRFWKDKHDYILKLHGGGQAEDLKKFAGVSKLWEMDHANAVRYSKQQNSVLVTPARRHVIQNWSKYLSLTVGWRDANERPLIYTNYGRELYFCCDGSRTFSVSTPEQAQWIMKHRGFNFMGIACISQILYVNGEYIFTEISLGLSARKRRKTGSENNTSGYLGCLG